MVAPDSHDEAEEDDSEADDYEGPAAPLFLDDGRRPGRIRKQAVQHNVGQFLLATIDLNDLRSSRMIKSRRLQSLHGIYMGYACLC